MRRWITALFLFSVKGFTHLFFKTESQWVPNSPPPKWNDVKLLVLLNHTSLFELLFVYALPFSFLWRAAKKTVVPIAEKTFHRPFVGRLLSLSAHLIPITRKRDASWSKFIEQVRQAPLMILMPEGRMLRRTGLDKDGKPHTVRGGIADVLSAMNDEGSILIAYSGGLHHVQAPGEFRFRLFQTLKVTMEMLSVSEYKRRFSSEESQFRSEIIADLEARKQRYCPS